ncbi:hypothetical protein V5O48_012913 [Marasmius crinis-equi]|uniref:Uncharacterized protein n=1 Tax=Marasmius crinis-equi TaxID=585013 RepID=A0ABR3F1T5_9AGAR
MTSVQAAPTSNTGNSVALVAKHKDVGSLNIPENQILIKDNIDILCEKIQNARKAFENISILLAEFKTREGEDIEPLRLSWNVLYKRYNDLVSKCETDANMIKILCDSYKANILSLLTHDQDNVQDIRIKLQAYINKSQKGAKMASENADSFNALRIDFRANESLDMNIPRDVVTKLQAYIWRSKRGSGKDDPFNTIADHLWPLNPFWEAVSPFEGDHWVDTTAHRILALYVQVKEELNGIFLHLNEVVSEATTTRVSRLVLAVELRTVADTSHSKTFRVVLGERMVGSIYETLGDTFETYIAQMYKLEEKKQNDRSKP